MLPPQPKNPGDATVCIQSGGSFTKSRNKRGLSPKPCGTPFSTLSNSEKLSHSPTLTLPLSFCGQTKNWISVACYSGHRHYVDIRVPLHSYINHGCECPWWGEGGEISLSVVFSKSSKFWFFYRDSYIRNDQSALYN